MPSGVSSCVVGPQTRYSLGAAHVGENDLKMNFFLVICLISWQFLNGEARGRRIDIFKQNSNDISQLRVNSASQGKEVMFNALPRNSPLKWDKNIDGQGNCIIPYVITGQYDSEEQSIIAEAMRRIQNNTCIRFKKRSYEREYLDLQNQQNEGCYTSVGRLPGKSVVMLEANEIATCVEVDIVIHELMHTIGLWHEHMRYDRDDYINVHYENIEPMYVSQFEKISPEESTTYGIKYDYRSVMHYAETAFAKSGKISMETLDPAYQKVIGNQRDASPSDYKKICIIYNCQTCMGQPFNADSAASGGDGFVESTARPEVQPTFRPITPPSEGKELPPIVGGLSGGDGGLGGFGHGNSVIEEGERSCSPSTESFCKAIERNGLLNCNAFSNFCSCLCKEQSFLQTLKQKTSDFMSKLWALLVPS